MPHPLFKGKLGGLGGYKQGGIGAAVDPATGEPVLAAYGILPRIGLLEERQGSRASDPITSKHALNLFGLEAEIGFVMSADLVPREASAYTEAEVWAAVGQVRLTIELVGRRFDLALAGDASSLQSLGDASCAGAVVLGKSWQRDEDGCPSPARLAAARTSIVVNGETRATGRGEDNPLGSPLASLTWCINHLGGRGITLRTGELVIAGACCKTRDWSAGDSIEVTFEGLGVVRCVIGE